GGAFRRQGTGVRARGARLRLAREGAENGRGELSIAMKLSTDNFIEAHGRLADALAGGDQSWLAERRARALDALAKVGLPTLRHEDWKYTDIRPLTARDYEFAGIEIGRAAWRERVLESGDG